MNQLSKKVLIITYYWPPAGGPGVQRWLKFVKYLPDFDIQPIVYIPENPTYPILDENLASEVSDQAIIIKKNILEPYQIASYFSKNKSKKLSAGIITNKKKQSFLERFLLTIRGNLFIPDARFLWVNPSVKFLEKYIVENKIDIIITSGPPHSLHLIGLKLKQKLAVKWLADFRDPWTKIGYHKELKLSNYAKKRHASLEKKVLLSADQIIVTSNTTKNDFQKMTKKPIEVITNGYDFEKIEKQILDTKFSLAHIGSFLSERNPMILWEVLSELIKEIPDFKNHLELNLIGITSQEVLQTIENFNLTSFVNNIGYVSHLKAIEHQKKSQILLLIEINSEATKSIIPGKIFEYMVSERPILAIGPQGSDFSEIIENTKTGIFVDYHQREKLKVTLISFYEDFLVGNLKTNSVEIEQYSRKNLTKKLAYLLQ
jgi:glycosyltransferase involved in cell wall biosynthesis